MFDNELPDPVWQLEQLLQVLPHPPQHNGALDTDHMQQCALHVPRCSLQQVIGRVMGKSFHSIFWSSKPSLSRQQRDRENKKASITHFYKCQYFLELSKRFCISAETLYRVSQSFVLVNTAQTGQLYWEWVQGSPPATATTGHLPSQSEPDTNAIYRSCCRTRQASQPLFINVQIGFISCQAEKKKENILKFHLIFWKK